MDLQSAYKQLAVHPEEQKRTVVTLWDSQDKKPRCYTSKVLPFGASASVHHFPRFSSFLQATGLHMGLCWAAYFDDFAILTHECHESSSLNAALGLFEVLGFQYSKDKLSPFSNTAELLGVELDMTETSTGLVKVQNKKSRIEVTTVFLEKMLEDKIFVASEMPGKLGKLQYAETQLWGRTGRLALADIRNACGKARIHLDDRSCRAVQGSPRP